MITKSPTLPEIEALTPRKAQALADALTQPRVEAAFAAQARWARRQARTEHPDGKFDGARRWVPSAGENIDGFTSQVRTPSRAWPMSYMLAARSLGHCEALEGAQHEDVLTLRRAKMLDGIDATTTPTAVKAQAQAQAVWSALLIRADRLNLDPAARTHHDASVQQVLDQRLVSAAAASKSDVVNTLLAHGADVHANDDQALREAAQNGHTEAAKPLLTASADPVRAFARDPSLSNSTRSLLDHAITESGSTHAAAFFAAHGPQAFPLIEAQVHAQQHRTPLQRAPLGPCPVPGASRLRAPARASVGDDLDH